MKRLLLSISMLLLAAVGASSQVTRMNIGYVNGEMNTSGNAVFTSSDRGTWVSGAMYIPAEKMKLFQNNHIDSIHAGLASRLNVDSLRVWIRTSLDGEDLASGAISGKTGSNPRAVKGWNLVGLESPYYISDNQGLYVGYSFLQSNRTVAMSIVNSPHPNALFVQLGSDAAWEDRSSEGALAVEAYVYGDNLPKYNLQLTELSAGPSFVIDKGELAVNAEVMNIGASTITGFDIECEIDGVDMTYIFSVDETIAYGERCQLSFTFNPDIFEKMPANRTLTATITNLREGADLDMSDNTLKSDFEVVQHDYARNVLIEEFTTEQCVNCPRVAGFLHEALEDERIAGYAVALCHHSGYYNDWLTIPVDNEFLWFYNGSTYAPAMMYDRYSFGNSTPVTLPGSAEEIVSYVQRQMSRTAYVCLNLKAERDADDENLIHITVTGERSKQDFTVNEPRINVMLYEDSIKARSQSGAGSDYIQMHVGRDINSTWGDVIEWDGDNYTYTCDFQIKPIYNTEQLGIVAWIWDYDSENPGNCDVSNTNSISLPSALTSVTTISTSENMASGYYDLNGRKLQSKPVIPGIFIEKNGMSIRKIIVK